jgi:VCBS repeat-containing protein
VGKAITVTAGYTDGQGTPESVTSTATASVANVNDAPTGSVTITGTVAEDETLTADTSGIADADGLGTFSYQWQRGGQAIAGATGASYTLTAADVGAAITVTVSYSDGHGTVETLTSAATAAVVHVNHPATINGETAGTLAGGTVVEDSAAVEPDGSLTLSGQLTLADPDGEYFSTTVTVGSGARGTLVLNAVTGEWGYSVANADIQDLATGQTHTDSFTVTSADGTASMVISIAIQGVDEPQPDTGEVPLAAAAAGEAANSGSGTGTGGTGGGGTFLTGAGTGSGQDYSGSSGVSVGSSSIGDDGEGNELGSDPDVPTGQLMPKPGYFPLSRQEFLGEQMEPLRNMPIPDVTPADMVGLNDIYAVRLGPMASPLSDGGSEGGKARGGEGRQPEGEAGQPVSDQGQPATGEQGQADAPQGVVADEQAPAESGKAPADKKKPGEQQAELDDGTVVVLSDAVVSLAAFAGVLGTGRGRIDWEMPGCTGRKATKRRVA